MTRTAIPKSIREKVYQKYGGHCAYCGAEIEYNDMQIDHLHSVRNYGENNDFENLMPSCRQCNHYKSTLSLDRFRREVGKIGGRLNSVYIYRLAKAYGLVFENPKEIKFYFEENNHDERRAD